MSRLGSVCVVCGALAMPAALAGCGAAGPKTTKLENSRLEAKVATLRADARRNRRRIRELERSLLQEKTREGIAAAPVEHAPPPPRSREPVREGALPVEVLYQDVDPVTGERSEFAGLGANGEEIRYAGEALRGKVTRLDERDLVEPPRLEPLPSADVGALPRGPARLPRVDAQVRKARVPVRRRRKTNYGAPKAEYQKYVSALQAGEFVKATAGLENFVTRFPSHDLADNAQYWLGEAHYAQRKYAVAKDAFQLVLDRFPTGNKVPDALLKLAFCQIQLGELETGRATLEKLLSQFPDSNPAALAARKLTELKG